MTNGMQLKILIVAIIIGVVVVFFTGDKYRIGKPKTQQEKNCITLKKDMVIRRGVKGAKDISKYSWIIKKGTRIYFSLK